MKSLISTISLIILFCQTAYCAELSGYLVIQSRGIQAVNLSSKKVTKLFKKGQSDLATHDQNLIFIQDGQLTEISLTTKETTQIAEGVKPLHSSKFDMLFFYSKSKNGVWLTSKKGNQERKLMKAPMPFTKWTKSHELYAEFIESAPIKISDDMILFVGENRNLWVYNIKNNELKDSGITNCTPRAYRTSKEEIVCESFMNRTYFLLPFSEKMYPILPLSFYGKTFVTTGKGQYVKMEELPIPKHSASFVYIPKHDVLAYTTSKGKFPFGERYPIEIYDFQSHKTQEILSSHSYQSGVWLESIQ
ncbi:MAG: hypothetical protein GY705_06035 [Bacteroidetes bacterium]|nr:hypothetical protein [Bacteroidota bacterium]